MSLYLPDDPTVVPRHLRLPGSIYRSIYAREIRLDRESRGEDAAGYGVIEAGMDPETRRERGELEDVGF